MEFTLDDLLKNSKETLEAKMEECHKICEESKKSMLLTTDEEELDDLLDDYIYYSEKKIETYEWLRSSERVEKIKHTYNLFSSMSYELSKELKATVNGDEIRFKWQGETIQFIVKLLAGKYNLHSKGFTFSSSFTTHEAYTEKDHCIHIGIDKDDSSTVLIQFHLLKR